MILMGDLYLRHSKIQSQISKMGADAALIATTANIFYAFGSVFNGYAYIPSEGEALFFVIRPVNVTGRNIHFIRKPENIPEVLSELGINHPKKLVLEDEGITPREWFRLSKLFSGAEILAGSAALREVRSIKTPYEIEIIKSTAKKHVELVKGIPNLYREGMTDLELSAEIERAFRVAGHIGLFRTFGFRMEIHMGTVLAGDNALVPSPYDFSLGGAGTDASCPIGPSGNVIENDTSVLVDVSFVNRGYITDMTRVFSKGRLPKKAHDAHRLSIEIQQKIMEKAAPGTVCEDLYNMAVDEVNKAGLAENFMGMAQQAKFVGHGLGIEINEPPVLAPRMKAELQENMVIALEPKFVFPGVGAVGTENTYLVTKNGLLKLTDGVEDIIEL